MTEDTGPVSIAPQAPPVGGGVIFSDMPTPIAFSDEQLDAIMRAAQPLAAADRERFVEAVTAAMQGRELGDGAVYLAIREAQRKFFAPPVFDPPSRSGGGDKA